MRNTPDPCHADLQTRRPSHAETPASAAPLAWSEGAEQASGWSLLLAQIHHVDQQSLRHINRALVLACIREYGPIARVQIAERTALSRATVSAITNALLRDGAIREGERLPSTKRGGRRAVLLHAMPPREGASAEQSAPPENGENAL